MIPLLVLLLLLLKLLPVGVPPFKREREPDVPKRTDIVCVRLVLLLLKGGGAHLAK